MLIADDLDKLLDILPNFVRFPLEHHAHKNDLIEVVMDLGRRPEARFPSNPEYLSHKTIDWNDLDYSIKRVGNFGGDNRAGIERTLHRISSVRNRKGHIIGLTCRVGRAVFGTINVIRDLLEVHQSILLLGKPGTGKTTAVREIARIFADEMEKRVVIIDTSNEIAGDGDIPHLSIGRARRMQVSKPELQHSVMIEAVENHMPEVIIIDEISTELEAIAACTIAERGVQLVGTAHGNYLESLIKNPVLSNLVGGLQYVTLGDEEAKRRGTQKSILERKASSAFKVVIEIHQRYCWLIHENVEYAIDQILQGSHTLVQRRKFNPIGKTSICLDNTMTINLMNIHKSNSFLINDKWREYYLKSPLENNSVTTSSLIKQSFNNQYNKALNVDTIDDTVYLNLYVYDINLGKIKNLIKNFNFPINITRKIDQADAILGLRINLKTNKYIKEIAKLKKIPIQTINFPSLQQISRALYAILNMNYSIAGCIDYKSFIFNNIFDNNKNDALEEVRLAIENIVIPKKITVELLPREALIRKIQHQLIQHYQLKARSIGEEPNRKLRILSN
uniref:Conserved hypothetical plastid protein n=1 Tax=Boldia erythrosiphon TaxID=74908 RepID=A0A1Y9TLV1_9RHOD|nr:conserved hypothetical plastid protein [Boldia erythrosiphon]ARO90612.1 conserved hypothetical plastid protein [Boldia erythrosiphon]